MIREFLHNHYVLKTIVTYVIGWSIMFAMYVVLMTVGLMIANFIEKRSDKHEKSD